MSLLFADRATNAHEDKTVDSVGVAKETAQQTKERIEQSAKVDWIPARKTQRFIDTGVSAEVEKLIWSRLKIRANAARLDILSSQWDYSDLMKATELAIQEALLRPMGHDPFIFRIESILTEASNT